VVAVRVRRLDLAVEREPRLGVIAELGEVVDEHLDARELPTRA